MDFGAWEPDADELNTGLLKTARNVFPGRNSYLPAPSPQAVGSALSARPRGFFRAIQESGSTVLFAGTETTLERYNSGTAAWDDVSQALATYGVPTGELWSWAQFGNRLIATQATDDPQFIDVETGTEFADLPNAPKARFVDVVRDYVFLGSLATDPYTVQWSGTNDSESWTPGTDNADLQFFPTGGRVMAVCGASELIIQERGIQRIIYSPGSAFGVFQFDPIEEGKGTIAPYSVVKYGPLVAYYSEDGFYMAAGNGESRAIGQKRINTYFQNKADLSQIYSMIGAFDPTGSRFIWLYRTQGSTPYDAALVYDWALDRWSELEIQGYVLAQAAVPGTTLEGLDSISASLDALTASLDSRLWQGGTPVLTLFGTDFAMNFLDGDALEATLETGEAQLVPDRRAMVTGIRPLVDTEDALARVGTKQRLADSTAWRAETAMVSSGLCPVRASGRYHRMRLRIPAGSAWTHARGLDVIAVAEGTR